MKRTNVNIPIVVAAYNRPQPLSRILQSLAGASYPCPVKLIISLDAGGGAEVLRIAKEFQWDFGKKEVIAHEQHLGLKGNILFCGDLSQQYGAAIVLEDDLYVSPFFYEFALQSLKFYKNKKKIAGISLYAHRFNENAKFPFYPLADGSDVFFMQIASSWGQIWTAKQWKSFRAWYGRNTFELFAKDHLFPLDLYKWSEGSWKKMFIAYMIATDQYFVYPRTSLTTNFGDPGAHHNGNRTFQVPLSYGNKKYLFKKLEDSVAVYDAFCEILPERLNRLCPWLKEYSYEVDLYGTKPLGKVKPEYLLTTRKSSSFVRQFGRELKPSEANVVGQLPGDDIYLARKEECEDLSYEDALKRCYQKKEMFYHYGILSYLKIADVV